MNKELIAHGLVIIVLVVLNLSVISFFANMKLFTLSSALRKISIHCNVFTSLQHPRHTGRAMFPGLTKKSMNAVTTITWLNHTVLYFKN